ncbi:LLM class flavin-dependent oxidoreductase [Euzebya pacifica]|uniref:LLM class flavin-dependent oxidoreductase n=1 Tax=Euzebya pacifica TaxID=1608957 RepID=UPI0030F562A2
MTPAPTPSAELGVPLGVLDLATVAHGSTERDALHRSVALAQHVEALGYSRIWVAEHHGMPAVASSATDVVMAHLAQATSTIRIGSGGIMLPNHAPLIVAERFATLEAFHPGRIDLGIGRAPGTDQRTAWALRRDEAAPQGERFVEEIQELVRFFDGDFPRGHHLEGMQAVPGAGLRPPLWLLGSSTFSAQVAALLGQRFAFAYHFAPDALDDALAAYRQSFRPSADLAEPYAEVAVTVVCADTDEEAQRLALSGALSMVRLRNGDLRPLPSPDEALAHPWDDRERAVADKVMSTWVVGSPERVVKGLRALLDRTAADELMIAGHVWDAEAHRRSYTLLAEAAGLSPVA